MAEADVFLVGTLRADPILTRMSGTWVCTLALRVSGTPAVDWEVRVHGEPAKKWAHRLMDGAVVGVEGQVVATSWHLDGELRSQTWIRSTRLRWLARPTEQDVRAAESTVDLPTDE